MNKRTIGYIYIALGLTIVFVVSAVFAMSSASLLVDDDRGVGFPSPPPPTEEQDAPPAPEAPELLGIIPYYDYDGEIHLLWSFVIDAQYYHVYRSKDGATYKEVSALPNSVYTYVDTVNESGTYKYKVKTEGIGGYSVFSNVQEVVVSLPSVIPDEPTVPTEPEQDTTVLTGNTETNYIIGIVIVAVSVSATTGYFYFLYNRFTKQKRVKK